MLNKKGSNNILLVAIVIVAAAFLFSNNLVSDEHITGYASMTVNTQFIASYNDCGAQKEVCSNVQGSIHTGPGKCDGLPEGASGNMTIDSGWMSLCSTDSILIRELDDCTGAKQSCPSGYTKAGQVHTGPAVCDNYPEGTDYQGKQLNAGWMTFCTKNQDIKIITLLDDCTGAKQSCPSGYRKVGQIHSGPGVCDGFPEIGVGGKSADSGWLGVCAKEVPVAPSCSDGIQNQQETDVDCGGPNCAACGNGKACSLNSDCTSNICTSNICTAAPSCSDGIQNQQETDVDCGGPNCQGCGFGKTCNTVSDCNNPWGTGGVVNCFNNFCEGCIENVDAGIDYGTWGNLTVFTGGSSAQLSDNCTSSTLLDERSCNTNTSIYTQTIDCSKTGTTNSCSAGKCI